MADVLPASLRKRLDALPPRALLAYLEERLGPAVAEQAVARALAGETVPLPPDTRSLAETLVEQVGSPFVAAAVSHGSRTSHQA